MLLKYQERFDIRVPTLYIRLGDQAHVCIDCFLLCTYKLLVLKYFSLVYIVFIQKISALGKKQGRAVVLLRGSDQIGPISVNYLTAILTANNELFNSASDNDNDC